MYHPTDASSAAPDGLVAELRAALVTLRFWITVALQSIPVVGVIWLGWSAAQIFVYFLAQACLTIALHAAAEATFGAKAPRGGGKLGQFAGVFVVYFAGIAALILALITKVKVPIFENLLSSDELGQRSFLIGLGTLTLVLVARGLRYVQALPYRTPTQVSADEERNALIVVRVVLLILGGFLFEFFRMIDAKAGNVALVVAIALLVIFTDGLPHAVGSALGMRRKPAERALRSTPER